MSPARDRQWRAQEWGPQALRCRPRVLRLERPACSGATPILEHAIACPSGLCLGVMEYEATYRINRWKLRCHFPVRQRDRARNNSSEAESPSDNLPIPTSSSKEATSSKLKN